MADAATPPRTSPGTSHYDDRGSELPITVEQAMALPARLRWQLAARYRASGDLAAAAALLDAIAAAAGESASLLDEQARLAYAAGQTGDAIALLTRRAEGWPSPSATVALARLQLTAGHLDQATALAMTLLDDAPDLLTVRVLAADVMRATGQPAAARAHLEQILAARPDHPGILLKLAEIALDGNDAAGAEALCAAALDAGDDLTSGQIRDAADIATALGDTKQAAKLTRRAAKMEAIRHQAFADALRRALPAIDDLPEMGADDDCRRGRPSCLPVDRRPTTGPPTTNGGGGDAGYRPAADEQTCFQETGQTRGSAPTADGFDRHDDVSTADVPPPPAAPLDATLPRAPEVYATLRADFGHEDLRPGQAAVIGRVLSQRDTLAIMPTGAGKSLTFQLPAMLLPAATLVISPLIALMKDQIESLPGPVRARTTLINSTLAPDEMRRRLAAIAAGTYQLIYAAPERLRQASFRQALRARGVSLVVVDEAHCITHWGHDFRPDYLTIPHALAALGTPSVLAITATATPAMAKAIGAGLGRELERVQISLFRPNLFYEVHQLANREAKITKLIELCRRQQGAGIVYVPSRRDAETLAGLLRQRGVNAVAYHAGLEPETRATNQERFMRGQARVIVATVAFGMGVNKADVRFIIHLSPPRSLEAYAQESGRAGRDGKPARCALLISPTDRANLIRLARRDEVDLDTLRTIYSRLKRQAAGPWAIVDPGQLLPAASDQDATGNADPRVALGILEQAGLLRRHPDAAVTKSIWWDEGAALTPPTPYLPPEPPSTGGRSRSQFWERGEPIVPSPSIGRGSAEGRGEGGAIWQRFAQWAGLDQEGGSAQLRTADACAALDLSPTAVEALLGQQPGVTVRDGPRLACLELLPVADNISARMNELLLEMRQTAERRIAQVVGYARGTTCRHALLARHLGEALAPCQTACDNCTRATTAKEPEQSQPATNAGSERQRTVTTAADALAVLQAVRTLPFPIGKPGLAKLLAGSVESRIRADRSPSFGALAELSRNRIGTLIDRLVEDGFLARDLNHEFKLISLTRRGAAATEQDLAAYESIVPAGSRVRRQEDASNFTVDDLTPAGRELFERLRQWRHEEATSAGLPPYVIAHDSMLVALAAARPTSADELARIKGFGANRIERYGAVLIALIASVN